MVYTNVTKFLASVAMSDPQEREEDPTQAQAPDLVAALERLTASVAAIATDVAALKAQQPPAAPVQTRLFGENVGSSGGPTIIEPVERVDPFGHHDPYMARGRGRRDERFAHQAEWGLQAPVNQGYQPR